MVLSCKVIEHTLNMSCKYHELDMWKSHNTLMQLCKVIEKSLTTHSTCHVNITNSTYERVTIHLCTNVTYCTPLHSHHKGQHHKPNVRSKSHDFHLKIYIWHARLNIWHCRHTRMQGRRVQESRAQSCERATSHTQCVIYISRTQHMKRVSIVVCVEKHIYIYIEYMSCIRVSRLFSESRHTYIYIEYIYIYRIHYEKSLNTTYAGTWRIQHPCTAQEERIIQMTHYTTQSSARSGCWLRDI